ncbi:hypothetical protein ACFYXF_31910 [Streptomyces sp. NPDC002680]
MRNDPQLAHVWTLFAEGGTLTGTFACRAGLLLALLHGPEGIGTLATHWG